jgi:hypothetical protein
VSIQQDGAQMKEGVRLSEGLARLRVRFLGWVRVLVGLGGRSTCVECPFNFLCKILGDLVVSGSFFPLGQGLDGQRSE